MARASIEALRRGEIADAAITVIAREGYEATTMRALAAELGVSTGTITHWYATKDDVLAAALGAAADRVAERIDTAVRDLDDPRAVLEAIGEASIPDTPAAIEEQRVWAELAARAARTPSLADLHGALYDGWRRRIERVVTVGQRTGVFPAVDAAAWARTYAALLDGLALHVLLHPGRVAPAAMRDAIRVHVAATLG